LLRLTMQKRILGGFAVVLSLLAVLAMVTLRGMTSMRSEAGRVSEDSALSAASTDVALQVGDAHARVVQYALSATMDDQKIAQDSLTRLDQTIERSRTAGVREEPSLQALATRYHGAVDATISAVEARRTAIEELQTASNELRTIVSAMLQLLEREADAAVVGAGARVAEAFGDSAAAAAHLVAARSLEQAGVANETLRALRERLVALAGRTAGNRRMERFMGGTQATQLRAF